MSFWISSGESKITERSLLWAEFGVMAGVVAEVAEGLELAGAAAAALVPFFSTLFRSLVMSGGKERFVV